VVSLSGIGAGSIVISTLNLEVENVGGNLLSASARKVGLQVYLNGRPYFPIVLGRHNGNPILEIAEMVPSDRLDIRLFEYHVGSQEVHVMNPASSRIDDGVYELRVVLTCREYRKPLTARFGRRLRIPQDFVSVL